MLGCNSAGSSNLYPAQSSQAPNTLLPCPTLHSGLYHVSLTQRLTLHVPSLWSGRAMLTSSSAASDSQVCLLLGTASLQILSSPRQWPVADVGQGGSINVVSRCLNVEVFYVGMQILWLQGLLCLLSIHSLVSGLAHTRYLRELLRMDHMAANLSSKTRKAY